MFVELHFTITKKYKKQFKLKENNSYTSKMHLSSFFKLMMHLDLARAYSVYQTLAENPGMNSDHLNSQMDLHADKHPQPSVFWSKRMICPRAFLEFWGAVGKIKRKICVNETKGMKSVHKEM